MRIAINGMGRIGRLLFRRLIQLPEFSVVAVNDLMDAQNLAYLLKYDSVYGPVPFEISITDTNLVANNRRLQVFNEPDPSALPWADLGVDLVLECTGAFTKKSLAEQHLRAGAKQVILSTTGSADIPLFIYGVHSPSVMEHPVLSPGGCMTNCVSTLISALAPLSLQSIQLNVIHSYTSRQQLVDAPSTDFRRGRAAAESIIPVTVDLAESLQRLFTQFEGKLTAMTTRVPVANGALADFTFATNEPLTAEAINNCLRSAAEKHLKGVLQVTEEPLASLDIKGNTHSAIVDSALTSVAGKSSKIMAFFDNEYGYTSRIIDWLMVYKKAGFY